MRCFIVGGKALTYDQRPWAVARGSGCATALLRAGWVCGTAAAAVVVMSPSAVKSARKAVMTTVHSFMTLFRAMVSHFRVGRFAYFPHDVYGRREITDPGLWRVDLQINTTRM